MRPAPVLLLVCLHAGLAAAASPSFERDIVPVLTRHCLGCHGAAVKMSNLDLGDVDAMLRGGSKGAAIVKGSAAASLLIQRVSSGAMPPGNVKLSASELAALREWIDAGAQGTASAAGPASHWAFQTPVRPAIPSVRNKAWVRTPVDAFVLAALESRGIAPAAPAERSTLLRRAALSLTGLPPDAAQRTAYLADRAPGADERLVERLLDSPRYGERWARRWLDVVRYAESNGYERDGTKPHAWRYRDWVIDAFNRDKPYNRFLTEQLAGDEMEGSNAETQIGATFLRLGTWDDEPAEPMLDRYDQLDDIVGATSAAFLGITLRCARCHDHKFEPLTQKDYYRALAVFSPLKRPQKDRQDLDRLVGTAAEIQRFEESKAKADAAVAELDGKVAGVKRTIQTRVIAEARKQPGSAELSWVDHLETVLAVQVEASKRNKRQKELVEQFNTRLDAAIERAATRPERAQLDAWRHDIAMVNAARVPEPPRAYIWYEDSPAAAVTRLLVRGDVSRPGEEVEPGVPGVLARTPLAPVTPAVKSTGRRLWLARWMTDPANPLVARVMVNRIWQAHFGEGLVPSENDFGVAGQRPSHPELLDWLAREFIDSGWSVKHIQRLIVNSGAFRLSAGWDEKSAAADPDQNLLWRWKPRRLEAEIVRDSMLAAGGGLNPAMHGPSIYPALPRAVLEGQSVPGQNWGTTEGAEAARRSIYIHVKRSLPVPELELLDLPDSASSCEQRSVSTTGPQALTFLNGSFARDQARRLAASLGDVPPADAVSLSFERVLGRDATPREVRLGVEFLAGHRDQIASDGKAADARQRALEGFALVLLNSNEFTYLN